MKRLFAGLLATTLVMAACSSDDDGGDTSSSATEPAETTELTVFAASSLTAVLQDAIGPAFEDANPGVTVSFNVGASDALAGQIQSEGTADVFASASGTWMDEVEKDPGAVEGLSRIVAHRHSVGG